MFSGRPGPVADPEMLEASKRPALTVVPPLQEFSVAADTDKVAPPVRVIAPDPPTEPTMFRFAVLAIETSVVWARLTLALIVWLGPQETEMVASPVELWKVRVSVLEANPSVQPAEAVLDTMPPTVLYRSNR